MHMAFRRMFSHVFGSKDNMGLNETAGGLSFFFSSTRGFQSYLSLALTDTSKSPRGIRGFQLNSGTFSEWKVQGKVGGYTKSVSTSSKSLEKI